MCSITTNLSREHIKLYQKVRSTVWPFWLCNLKNSRKILLTHTSTLISCIPSPRTSKLTLSRCCLLCCDWSFHIHISLPPVFSVGVISYIVCFGVVFFFWSPLSSFISWFGCNFYNLLLLLLLLYYKIKIMVIFYVKVDESQVWMVSLLNK